MSVAIELKRDSCSKVFRHLIDYRLNEINQAKKQLIGTIENKSAQDHQAVWHPENCQNFNQFLTDLLDSYHHFHPETRYYKLTNLQSETLAQRVIFQTLKNKNSIRLSTGANLNQPNISVSQFLRARSLKAHYFLTQDQALLGNQLSNQLESQPTNQSVFNQVNQSYQSELSLQNLLDETSLIELLIDQFDADWIKPNQILFYHPNPTPLESKLFQKLAIEPIQSIATIKKIKRAQLAQSTQPERSAAKVNISLSQENNHGIKVYPFKTKKDELDNLFQSIQLFHATSLDQADRSQLDNDAGQKGLVVCAFHKKKSYQSLIDQARLRSEIDFLDFDCRDFLIDFKEFNDAIILLSLFIERSVDLRDLITSLSSGSFYYQLFNQQKLIIKLKTLKTQRVEIQDWIDLIQIFDAQFANSLSDFEKKLNGNSVNGKKLRQGYSQFAKIFADFLYQLKWQVVQSNPLNIDLANKTATFWQYLHQVLDELSTLDLFQNQPTSNEFLQVLIDLIKSESVSKKINLSSVLLIDYQQIALLSNPNLESISAIYLIGIDESFSKMRPLNHHLDLAEQKEKIVEMNAGTSYQALSQELIAIAPKIKSISFAQSDNEISHELSPMIRDCFKNYQIEIQDQSQELSIKCDKTKDLKQNNHFSLTSDSIKNNLDSFNQASVTQLDRYHQCNFLGFAERVLVKNQQQIQSEPKAREKGILLHQCIENFFSKINNFAALLHAKNNNQLESIQANAIDDALKKINQYSAHYLQIEKRAIKELLNCLVSDLLNDEKNKDFQILSSEEKIELARENFNLKGKIDAIEKKSNQVSLIDYKTSSKQAQSDSLQLMLYYWMIEKINQKNNQEVAPTDLPKQINQAAYRHLFFKDGRPRLENNQFDQEKLDSFLDWIEVFIGAYQSGHLAIRYDSKICQNCQFRSLCRIDERRFY